MAAPTRRKALLLLAQLLLYLLATFLFHPGPFLRFSDRVPYGDQDDLQFILSIVDHAVHADLRDQYHFPMFYPESRPLTRTHPLFGISVFFKAFRLAGLNLEQSANLYVILGLIAGAFGCFLLAREASGSVPAALAFSLLYIVHPINPLHFVWLNFFSRFWVPYVLFFLLRYFRGGGQRTAAAAAAFSFLEMFACIHSGTVAWVFLLPGFILAAWALKMIGLRRLLALAGWFLLALLLILAVFHPYLEQGREQQETGGNRGVQPADLIGRAAWLAPRGGDAQVPLLPGGAVLAAIALFFVRARPGRRLAAFLLLCAPLPALIALASRPGPWLEALFMAWLALLALALLRGWKETTATERLLAIGAAFFVLTQLRLEHLPGLRSVSLFGAVLSLAPPLRDLRFIERAFFAGLPLFIALGAAGAARLPQLAGSGARARRWGAVLALLVVAENLPLPMPGTAVMRPIPYRDTGAYAAIPFQADQVVLEIPYHFIHPVRNSTYLLNWRFHRNFLLNGKGRARPVQYWRGLAGIIGRRQDGFLTDARLQRLLHDYSVNWVVIHWDLLRLQLRKSFDRERILADIGRLRRCGRLAASTSAFAVVELGEFAPAGEIVRTYSDFHLRRHVLAVELKSPPPGTSARLNGAGLPPPLVSGRRLFLDLRLRPLRAEGNRVELRFGRPVDVRRVWLWPEKRPLPAAAGAPPLPERGDGL
jgi:hypothetical protein